MVQGARVARGALYVTAQSATMYVEGLIFYVIVARLLPTSDIGSLSILTFAYYTFIVIVRSAIGGSSSLASATIKYISEHMGRDKPEEAAAVSLTMKRLILSLAALILIATILLSNWFSSLLWGTNTGASIFIITSIAAFFAIIKWLYASFLQGLQMFKGYAVVTFLAVLLSRFVSIALVIAGYGLTGVVVGWVIGEFTGVVTALYYFRGSLPKARSSYPVKTLLSFGLPMLVFAIVSLFSDWIDRVLFLALTSNLTELGVYDLAIRGSRTLSVIWMTVAVTIFPTLSELHGRRGKHDFTSVLKTSSRYLTYLIFPSALGLAAISRSTMALLFGWKYNAGGIPLSILATATVLWAFYMLFCSSLQALGKTKVFVKISAIAVLADIVVLFSLAPILGVLGVALARAAMMSMCFSTSYYELRRHIRVEFDGEALWKGVAATAIMVILLGILDAFFSGIFFPPLISVTIELALGAFVYGAMILIFRGLNKNDFKLLLELTPKRFHKIFYLLERILTY